MDYLNRLLRYKSFALAIVTLITVVLTTAENSSAQNPYELKERVFDFGYVGIDYKIFHTFTIINTRQKPIRIDSVKINCDCTTVRHENDIIIPGGSEDFRLTFDTKDFYGPVERNFQVFLSLPEKRIAQFFYLATIGQWYYGLKPEPFSVFILPAQNQQVVKITNSELDKIKVEPAGQYDQTFKLEFKKDEAGKGEQVEVIVNPSSSLEKGTYLSNFTLKVTSDDLEEPKFLTIPVKIARF